MAAHIYATAEDCAKKECNGCMICHGGLALCKVCGGVEGALTTDCCGYMLDDTVLAKIYKGELDFRNYSWDFVASPNSPASIREMK